MKTASEFAIAAFGSELSLSTTGFVLAVGVEAGESFDRPYAEICLVGLTLQS